MEELNGFNKPVQPNLIFLYLNNRLYMLVGYPVTNRTQYLLVIEISLDRVGKDLSFFEENLNNTTYLLDEHNDFILSSNVLDPEGMKVLKRQVTGQQRVLMDGNPFLLFKKRSTLLQWTLIAVLKEDDVLAPVNSFKKWYWILSAISILIIFTVSFIIFRLIHRPL